SGIRRRAARKVRSEYETVLNEDRQGAWPRCADIDPAERGRVDRIGIPQRKTQEDWIADGGNGSKCERLTTSICFPVYPNNRTLLKTIVSSDSGQQQKWIG